MSWRFEVSRAIRKSPSLMCWTAQRSGTGRRSARTNWRAISRRPNLPISAMKLPTACCRGEGQRHSPLALFDALRTDFSLARLRHYTGTPPSISSAISCSPTITAMSTNSSAGPAHRSAMAAIPRCRARAGCMSTSQPTTPAQLVADSTWRRHQMPAYHLMAPDGRGLRWSISASGHQMPRISATISP